MLLNEYRLQPWKKEHQEFIVQQMEAYFFGEGSEKPKEFVAAHRSSSASPCRMISTGLAESRTAMLHRYTAQPSRSSPEIGTSQSSASRS